MSVRLVIKDLENCGIGTRLLMRFLHVGALMTLVLGAGWIGWMWATGTEYTWGNRTPSDFFAGQPAKSHGPAKGGDLIQHYAAGNLWRDGQKMDLYTDYRLGKWINGWYEGHGILDAGSHDRLNYVYSPLVSQIAAWGAGLPFTVWMPVYLGTSILSYLVGVWLLVRFLIPSRLLSDEGMLVAFAFPSFYFTLTPFQTSTITLLIFVAAGCLLKEGRSFLGGLLVSCAFYKPQLMPWLAAFLLLAGNVRAGVGIIIGSALWLGATILFCGWSETMVWLSILRGMAHGEQFVLKGLNQTWTGCLGEWFTASPSWAGKFGFILGVAIFFWLAWKIRTRWERRDGPWPLFLGCAAWTVCSTYVGYYEILLTLPCCLGVLCADKLEGRRILLTLLLWIFSLFSISGVATSSSTGHSLNLTAPLITFYLIGAVYLLESSARRSMKEI